MDDQWGAFCNHDIHLKSLHSGSLDGYTFAVKDVFQIRGMVAGAGSPEWKRTHPPAERHADAMKQLLEDGATCLGTTHSDELMFSLSGENYHYGTPLNPRALQRIPGGSSSGSVVAAAAGLVDFAIGTDTGGSIRVPASYCGVYGIRPTYGAVSMEGVIPLAPSFDTVGWFAQDAHTLEQVGRCLLKEEVANKGGVTDFKPVDNSSDSASFRKLYIGEEMLGMLRPDYRKSYDQLLQKITGSVKEVSQLKVAEEGLDEWMRVFRMIQGAEVWQTHKDWIRQEKPRFGPGVAERFAWSETLDNYTAAKERARRTEISTYMHQLLGEDGLLVMPTSPGIAPLRNTPAQELEETRSLTLKLCCIAGLAGLPQVSAPWLEVDGAPLGISFIAGPGQDLRLLSWVRQISSQINSYSSVQNL